MYAVCNSLILFEKGSVSVEVLVDVNVLCISSICRYSALTVCTRGWIYGFFLANDADAVVDAGTDKIIFLHHSAGKNTGFDLFSLSVSNSEADGWIFMLILMVLRLPFLGRQQAQSMHPLATVDYSFFVVVCK